MANGQNTSDLALAPSSAFNLNGATVTDSTGNNLALSGANMLIRMIAVGGSGVVGTFALLAVWQGVTPRSIAASLR